MQPAELESKRSSPSYADMLLLVHGASTGKATASDDRVTCCRVQVQIYYRLTDRFAVSSDLSNPGWVGAVVSVCQQQGSWKVWIETKGGQFVISYTIFFLFLWQGAETHWFLQLLCRLQSDRLVVTHPKKKSVLGLRWWWKFAFVLREGRPWFFWYKKKKKRIGSIGIDGVLVVFRSTNPNNDNFLVSDRLVIFC